MRRFSQRHTHSALTEINITPLLDLCFVLLIIFIITTPLIEKSIDVSLPTSTSEGKAIDPRNIHVIEIDKVGKISLGKERIDMGELGPRLAELHRRHPDAAVLVRGDKVVKLQELTSIIDAIQKAGISKFGIATTPPQ